MHTNTHHSCCSQTMVKNTCRPAPCPPCLPPVSLNASPLFSLAPHALLTAPHLCIVGARSLGSDERHQAPEGAAVADEDLRQGRHQLLVAWGGGGDAEELTEGWLDDNAWGGMGVRGWGEGVEGTVRGSRL